MSHSRLSLALDEGALALPETGRIAVFSPSAETNLSALDAARVVIVQPFFPDHRYWAGLGFETTLTPEPGFAAALVIVPRAKALAQALVAEAARVTGGGLVIVDGQKTDGVDSMVKALRGKVALDAVMSKAHGKILWFTGGDFADWVACETRLEGGFITRPGVFSADGIDKGSAALVAALPASLSGRVADLGAGWGYLSRAILERPAVAALDLIEADHNALDCARKNITDPRAAFVWADATDYDPRAPYDVVVSNPPFHVGREGDPGLGRAFIRTAARILKPSGQFWMVANRHLPYEQAMADSFAEVHEAGGTAGFKVLHAAKPRRNRR